MCTPRSTNVARPAISQFAKPQIDESSFLPSQTPAHPLDGRRDCRSRPSQTGKFTAAAAMIGTLAVAIVTISKTRDGAGAFAARVGLGGASGTHSAPGYGYGPLSYKS